MIYLIEKLNRTVDLEDELVHKYEELGEELRDYILTADVDKAFINKVKGGIITDEELAFVCNNILIKQINTLSGIV